MARKSNERKVTGPEAASKAGKLLADPKTPRKVKSVAASDLTQTPNRKGTRKR